MRTHICYNVKAKALSHDMNTIKQWIKFVLGNLYLQSYKAMKNAIIKKNITIANPIETFL